MPGRGSTRYAQTKAIKLIELAMSAFGPLFTVEQLRPLAAQQGISASRLYWFLSRLAKTGWIESVKRGTYAIRGPFFNDPIPPFAIADALVQPAAISHWSALAHHGLTTQMPRMVQASTPRAVVTPEMREGQAHRPRGRAVWKALGVEVEFIRVQGRHFFGHQKIWVNTWRQVSITDLERTVLDLVARPDVFGGIRPALDIFEESVPQIEIGGLIRYALAYNVGATIKRLGWALEQAGISGGETQPLRAYPVQTYYRLDPQNPPGDRYNACWHIIENLGST
jgi:predicted transcriptional regulator of viral defense system